MNLSILDDQRQELVKEALSEGRPETVKTAILAVEQYNAYLPAEQIDNGIAAAEILLALEKKLWT